MWHETNLGQAKKENHVGEAESHIMGMGIQIVGWRFRIEEKVYVSIASECHEKLG